MVLAHSFHLFLHGGHAEAVLRGLFLALCLVLPPGSAQGTLCSVENQSRISCTPEEHLNPCIATVAHHEPL